MRRIAAAVALLFLAVPAIAGIAAWSGCALPEPPRCCCRGDDDGCGCGCGAGQAPARAPEPVAPLPPAPEHSLAVLAALVEAPVGAEARPLVGALHPQSLPPVSDLVVATCAFRC
jgi:hypothetical protein